MRFGSTVYNGIYWCAHRFARITKPVYVRWSIGYDGHMIQTGSLVLAQIEGMGPSLCRVLGYGQRCDHGSEPWPDGSLIVLVFAGPTLYRRVIQPSAIDRILSTDMSGEGVEAVKRAWLAFIGPLPDYATIATLDDRGALSGHHIGTYTDASGALKAGE